MDQNRQLLVCLVFAQTLNFERLFRLSLSYERPTSGQNVSKPEPYLGEKGPRNPSKRGHFTDAASPRKYLKIYNLTNANATLMKLTPITYLHWTFYLADWCVTHRAQEGVTQNPFKMSHKISFWLNFRCFLRIK